MHESTLSFSASLQTSVSFLCPDPWPRFHLSALAALTPAWLPVSIFASGEMCWSTPVRVTLQGSAATAWPIAADLFATAIGTSAAGAALSNDDLINGDTLLAVEWDAHWQGASRGFQRLMVKIEKDMRHSACEDEANGGQASERSGCAASVNVLLLIWWCVFILYAGNTLYVCWGKRLR